MSLVGLCDMSVIETPPKDRMAIQTVVAAWDDKLIQSAIEQELERGGQVYFVHNRVDTIWEIAAKIQELIPGGRVAVGHGQMTEGELEKVMLKFMHHEEEIQLNLGLNIRIPADYIQEENQRLRMYKRVAGVESESRLADVRAELQDRYGEPPAAVRNLLDYASLKLLSSRVGVTGIERK